MNTTRTPRPRRVPGRFRRLLSSFFLQPTVMVFVGLIVVAAVVVPVVLETTPLVTSRPEYLLKAESVVVTPKPPRWVPTELFDEVIGGDAWPEEGSSVLDASLLQRVADAFSAHPWVAEVVRVERSIPARIEVVLRYRRPVAWVEAGSEGSRVPIDLEAVRLPAADFTPADINRYPLIRGVNVPPPVRAGDHWDDPGLPAAVRLARAVAPHWEPFGLLAIEVEVRGDEKKSEDRVFLTMITRGGSRVLWGRPPGTRHPGELSVAQKLGRLKQFIARFDSLDPPHGPFEINIRHWREIIYRPLKSDSAQLLRLPVRVLR